MRDQGRDTIYRDDWDKLALYDQVLDRAIALGLLMDFLGHVSAIVSGRLAASEPPGMPLLQSREGMNPVERLMADASEPPGEPSETGGGPVAPGA